MKHIILFVATWLPLAIMTQESYIKSYDFGTAEYVYQIALYKNRLFINTATWCGVECSFLAEIDPLGNILWRAEVPDIDIAQGTMVIVNDTITVTGNNDPLNNAFRMAHFTLNGVKLGTTVEIEHPTRKYTRMFQLTTKYLNNRFMVCGTGKIGTDRESLVYVVSRDGVIDTLISLMLASKQSVVWDSYIDNQGRLTTFHWIEEDDSDINYRKIYKFNATFDTVWTYRTEDNWHNYAFPRGCELQDGRTILVIGHPIDGYNLHSVRAINPDGTTDWQYDYEWYGSRIRDIYRIKTLKNGDIMGSGSYSELAEDPRIEIAPWLFRMSPEGELLWERAYYEYDSAIESSRIGTILDFAELDNGDIIAVGNVWYDDDDMLIMRVDSNGCLDPGDCHEVITVDITTGTQDLSEVTDRMRVFPNPSSEFLYFGIDASGLLPVDYTIVDIHGSKLQDGRLDSAISNVNVANLPNGMYFLYVYEGGKLYGVQKFVKVNE
ncbi:MAG TPA: T9SS type A sorting domain-containing protein [Saprospiraceae bacterium]|nr:T9SS type A sorting domain-containing protein [Saprospiraceae bacterium]